MESNQLHNTKYGGPYQTATGARDLVVRNGYYRNVYKGPYWSLGAQGVKKLVVEGNTIEMATAAPNTEYAAQPQYPLNCKNCGAADFFSSKTPAGVLLRGYNDTGSSSTAYSYNELETEADEAFILAFMKQT